MKTNKGTFKPKFPQKYKGDPTNITYRSGWELKFMIKMDTLQDVISWSSEEVIIPYKSPIDNKWHRYFPDFLITTINKEGKKKTILIEIKPAAQTRPPKKQSNITRRYITEVKTWGVNESKWKAAMEYCKDRGWEFQILTEKELGIA
jgi:hypothetical protein